MNINTNAMTAITSIAIAAVFISMIWSPEPPLPQDAIKACVEKRMEARI